MTSTRPTVMTRPTSTISATVARTKICPTGNVQRTE
jgi:hypothetical protein